MVRIRFSSTFHLTKVVSGGKHWTFRIQDDAFSVTLPHKRESKRQLLKNMQRQCISFCRIAQRDSGKAIVVTDSHNVGVNLAHENLLR